MRPSEVWSRLIQGLKEPLVRHSCLGQLSDKRGAIVNAVRGIEGSWVLVVVTDHHHSHTTQRPYVGVLDTVGIGGASWMNER